MSAPTRRLDVALPADAPMAELLPHLLRHAGESVADDGQRHGGWALYRATGGALDTDRALRAQGVHDGEVLHLRAARLDWPDVEYDDLVDAIVSGTRRRGRWWTRSLTRLSALTVAGVALAVGLAVLVQSGPPLAVSGTTALVVAAALAGAGILLSRALADATAGALAAGGGLLYAFVGGFMVAAPAGTRATALGAPDLMLGSAALLTCSVLGYIGVGGSGRLFVAGAMLGVAGLLAGLLGVLGVSGPGPAAVLLILVICLLSGYPLVSIRLGRLPVPSLPVRPEDILRDDPLPHKPVLYSAVERSQEILAGLLLATGIITVVAGTDLAVMGGLAAPVLAAEGAAALLLRSRLFSAPRQRIPLIAGGTTSAALLVMAVVWDAPDWLRVVAAAAVVVLAGFVTAAGLVFGRRPPSPYLSRLSDLLDIVVVLLLVPTGALVVGLAAYVQQLLAGAGH